MYTRVATVVSVCRVHAGRAKGSVLTIGTGRPHSERQAVAPQSVLCSIQNLKKLF